MQDLNIMPTHQKIRILLKNNGINVGKWQKINALRGAVNQKFIGDYEVSKYIGTSVLITSRNNGSFGHIQSFDNPDYKHPIFEILKNNGYKIKRQTTITIIVN